MTCQSCSTELPDDAKFCAACGHQVAAVVERPSGVLRRVRSIGLRNALAATCAVLLLAGCATVVLREHARSERLDRTLATLSSTRADLDQTKDDLKKSTDRGTKLTSDLKASQARASSLNTQLTGVRGSLKATSSERDVLRRCFAGFLESLDAAYVGDRATFDRIWARIKGDCDKADRLLQ